MFQGSMVALVTPLKNGKIDFPGLKRLVEFHLENGTDVIVPCGTTGEAATMSHKEHCDVLSYVTEVVNKQVPVICGAGSNNTAEAVLLVKHAKKIKADGVLVVTPYYNKPTQIGLYKHFEFLAKKVDIPFVLYNVPSRTGVSMDVKTVTQLAKIPNVVAIKEASGSLNQATEIIQSSDITVISGDDALTLPLLSVGARGVISVVANIIPNLMSRLVHSYLNGDIEDAQQIHYQIYDLAQSLFIETNPIPVKTALSLMGMVREEFRLPLCTMEKANKAKLKSMLTKHGLIKRKKKAKA